MTKKINKKQIKTFQKEILDWYTKNKRDLPWRRTTDPYKILVSEVMSQQTQISRVVSKYEAWITVFPTIESLANASTHDVLKYWSGLGYNRRALYLQKCAQTLVKGKQNKSFSRRRESGSPTKSGMTRNDSSRLRSNNKTIHPSIPFIVGEHKGRVVWPQTEKELMELPGIGKYTARAILSFAYDKQVAVVDTNVRKVILAKFPISNIKHPILNKKLKNHHSGALQQAQGKLAIESQKGNERSYQSANASFQDDNNKMTDKEMEEIAEELLPKGKAKDWNQALMDYANLVLKKNPSTALRVKKQSVFLDSDRFYRGQIIKLLIQKGNVPIQDIEMFFPTVEKDRLKKIITGLEKDKLIRQDMNMLALP